MIVSIPKFNYCDVVKQIRMISDGLFYMSKFGDGRMGCTIRAMRHLLTNFTVNEQDFSIFTMMTMKDGQKFMLSIKITNENRKPIRLIVKYEFLMSVTN
jgi:hypothetical protein